MTKPVRWADRIGRNLRLRDLHVLMAVAQAGSMSKAARQLAISQPVISKTITDLEHMFGIRLLDRTSHGVEPTLYGRALLRRGLAVFDELRQSVKEIEFLADPGSGELRVGSTEAMITGMLPVIIKRLKNRHPRLTFEVPHTIAGAQAFQALRERSLDLFIGRVPVPVTDQDLATEILFDDPQFVVTGVGRGRVFRRTIELAEVIDGPWVMPSMDSGAGAVVAETFRACGLEPPRAEIICNSLVMSSALIEEGRYLGVFPASVLRFAAKRFRVRALPINLPALPRPVGITMVKGRTISAAAQVFIDTARQVAQSSMRAR
jgi:DNA-binding transcriptional LysR family regulator